MPLLLPAPADFSFAETVSAHGWRRLLPFTWHDETQTLERVEQTAHGVALLTLHADGDTVVVDGGTEELAPRVRRMLQMDIDLAPFHAYCASRPELAHLAACKRGRLLRSPTLWEDAVKVIATTNTTWTQTIAMCARLCAAFGSPLPSDPERHAFPTAAQVAAVPFAEFADGARMGYRNASVHAIAVQIAEGTLDLEAWQTEADADVLQKQLLSLPGVGPYAAACLLLYLGKPVRVNSDSVARALLSAEWGRTANDKDVFAFFAEHGDWRGLVYNFYPWREP